VGALTWPRLHGGSDVAVVALSTIAPHPVEVPGPIDAQNELAASAPPSEEGVISPSSSAPAVPDSSVIVRRGGDVG
jgi:hypothetical protein